MTRDEALQLLAELDDVLVRVRVVVAEGRRPPGGP
jgi:hypothetical protein